MTHEKELILVFFFQMSLESDVGEQLAGLLRALETASGRALSALQPHSHTVLELLKVCPVLA